MDNQFDQIYDCVTIESTVLHQFESYLQHLSCMNILCSLSKRGGLKKDSEIGISILRFDIFASPLSSPLGEERGDREPRVKREGTMSETLG